jgi:secreted trypsin-like serine protease
MRAHKKLVRGPLWATLVAGLVAAGVSLMVFAQSGKAIVGGEKAEHGKYPFMVSLQADAGPKSGQHFCGGSVIKSAGGVPLYVLTAAHCLADPNRKISWPLLVLPNGDKRYAFTVVAGQTNRANPNQGHAHTVLENNIFIHPSYRTGAALGSPFVYDVAVIKVYTPGSTALPMSHGLPPQPIKLATAAQDYMEEPGRIVTTLGWGATTSAAPRPSLVLTWAQVPLVSDDVMAKNKDYHPDLLVAAGGLPGTGACLGDSGGVLFSRDEQGTPYQIGVTQGNTRPKGGPPCPTGKPDRCAEVNEPRIRDFIEKVAGPLP